VLHSRDTARPEPIPLSYLSFVLANRRFLAFGLMLACFSSFGQTFFIALFGADIRAEFGLTDGQWGLLYSIATVTSACCLIWLGRMIDHVDLRLYAALVCAGLVGACFLMAAAPASSLLLLTMAVFSLRLTGQGLMSHTAITTMARYFDSARGKAMSIAGLGFPIGEAALPITAVLLARAVGWRQSWVAIGCVLAVVTIPMTLWLLRGHAGRHRDHVDRLARAISADAADGDDTDDAGRPAVRHWTRREVLHDRRFYLVLPAVLAPAFIVTGLFLHQAHLVAEKGWTMTWFAASFMAFAAAQLPSSLIAGPLVDRIGATRLLPYVLVPLVGALLALAASDHKSIALVFMVLAGITSGLVGTVFGAMWAELYGVAHLGAIRALVSALAVFSTALSPVTMGLMIDADVSMEAISLMCVVYVVVATGLAMIGRPRRTLSDPATA